MEVRNCEIEVVYLEESANSQQGFSINKSDICGYDVQMLIIMMCRLRLCYISPEKINTKKSKWCRRYIKYLLSQHKVLTL